MDYIVVQTNKSMKKFLPILILILLSSACREDLITETTVIDEPIPTNTYLYELGVFGLVLDENGTSIEEASVKASGFLESTDLNGYFEFDALDASEEGIYIAVQKEGYVNGGVMVFPNEENAQQIRVVLIEDNSSTLISSATGGVVKLENGSEVVIPANAFDAEGDVTVKAHFIPSSKENFHDVYPSALVGKDANDDVKYLNSIGAIIVEFTDDKGNELNIKSDIEVLLKLPIPQDAYNWPEEIILWSLNEITGYWEAESTAKKVGDFYEGMVSHFSWWSASEPADLVDVCFTIKDENGDVIPNIELLFLSWYTGYIQSGYTDSEGGFCTKLGEGDENLLFIVDECFNTLYEGEYIAVVGEDEKEIIVSSLPVTASFEGSIRTCDGSLVEDGYLSFDLGHDKRVVPVENGKYAFTSYCAIADASIEVLAVDRSDFSSAALTIEIESTKTNYLRDITLCGSLETYLRYENVTKATETIFTNCKALKNPTETLIVATDAENAADNVLLGIEGFDLGEFGTSFLGSSTETALPETFKTVFTTYQNVGGFVEGTFEGVTDGGEMIEGQFKAIRTK